MSRVGTAKTRAVALRRTGLKMYFLSNLLKPTEHSLKSPTEIINKTRTKSTVGKERMKMLWSRSSSSCAGSKSRIWLYFMSKRFNVFSSLSIENILVNCLLIESGLSQSNHNFVAVRVSILTNAMQLKSLDELNPWRSSSHFKNEVKLIDKSLDKCAHS